MQRTFTLNTIKCNICFVGIHTLMCFINDKGIPLHIGNLT